MPFFDAFCCVVEEVAQILLMGAPDLCLPWSGATFPRGKKSGQNSSEQLWVFVVVRVVREPLVSWPVLPEEEGGEEEEDGVCWSSAGAAAAPATTSCNACELRERGASFFPTQACGLGGGGWSQWILYGRSWKLGKLLSSSSSCGSCFWLHHFHLSICSNWEEFLEPKDLS